MNTSTTFEREAQLEALHLEALRAAVAQSPIVVAPPAASTHGIADWANIRRSADVDSVVLTWIAGHVRGGTARGTIH
jgi:hypothetical protein